jgi:hypothetical protein
MKLALLGSFVYLGTAKKKVSSILFNFYFFPLDSPDEVGIARGGQTFYLEHAI